MSFKLTDQFNVTTYWDANENNRPLVQQYDSWVVAMTEERNREDGFGPTGALNWVHGHYPTQTPGSLFDTFMVAKKDDGVLVATATVAIDDRGIGAVNNIGQDAFMGFVQVDPDYRGLGIGTAVCEYTDAHIQNWADNNPKKGSLRVALFTANPVAAKIYKNLGYSSEGQVYVPEWKKSEELFAKQYRSANAAQSEQEVVGAKADLSIPGYYHG